MADEDPPSTPPADLPGIPLQYKLDSCWVINLPVPACELYMSPSVSI